MRAFNILSGAIYLFTLTSSVLSAPIEPTGDTSPRDGKVVARATPPLPTLAECKQQLNVAKDNSLFYSGPGGFAKKAKKWATDNKPGYKILGQQWKDTKWQDQWQNDEDVSFKFFDLASQAMAELSTGTVYVMLPSDTSGTDWWKGTVWDRAEWPNIKHADRIIRVNPDNDKQETIWVCKTCPTAGQGTAKPTSAKPTAPYAASPGQCHIHVNQFEDCGDDTKNLSVEVFMWDVAGNQIGYEARTEAGATNPLSMKSKLESPLVITPEHRGDYIQFTLGTENWTSRDNNQDALVYCNTGGWDPREGPSCSGEFPSVVSVSAAIPPK
ncbi:MAG: hypothetical protein M1816_000562 [Peltula sp. TS41687]|nr:MAG: hypothetical protein M1816_000562 [Peltula sp. TS41687]